MPELPTGTVTFLFSDIEGSTRLLQRLETGYTRVLETHQRLLRDAFVEAGGIEVATEGDSFFVVFRSAVGAVAGAVAAQRALVVHPWPEGEQVRVRMGIHSGEGVLGAANYVGLDVHRAARIASAAHGGQVLLSASTAALVEGSLASGVTLRDLGVHRLKDLGRPERLVQLVIADLAADFPPLRSLDARPNNLPLQLTSFVGREREIETLRRLLSNTRLLTLTGPGGAGKTRLSLQVAAELLGDFADGVFFVALEPLREPAMLAPTIAQALGIKEEMERTFADSVRDELRPRELLLVLDNFEQVMAGAPLVGELLALAPGLKVIATSREVLHLHGEQEFPVPPLGLPDPRGLPSLEALSQYGAVALFIERARAVRPGFAVTNQNAPAVAEICARLDGLPLAIELAAARVKLFTPEAILARLGSRLALLTGGARDLPARQQTLRGAIDWSHDLLEPGEQTLFRRLAVFVGGMTIEAAEAVATSVPELGIDIVDRLTSLVDKSLLRQEEGEHGEPRFSMLETIREYGVERLAASGEAAEIGRRHAAVFLALAEEAAPELLGARQAEWLGRLGHEHDNLRAALRWAIDSGEAEIGLRLGGALWRFWHLRGHLREGRTWFDRMLALPAATTPTRARAVGLTGAGGIAYWQGDYTTARAVYEESLGIWRGLGDTAAIADSLINVGMTAGFQGDQVAAVRYSEEAVALYRGLGDRYHTGRALVGYAMVGPFAGGDYAAARPLLEEGRAIFREVGDRFWEANVMAGLGAAYLHEGDLDAARRLIRETLLVDRELGDVSAVANMLDTQTALLVREGRFLPAVRLAGAANSLRETIGGGLTPTILKLGDSLATARQALAPEAFASAYEAGQALGLDQAIEEAMRDD